MPTIALNEELNEQSTQIEEQTKVQETVVEETTQATTPFTLKVKYNHEEKELMEDEAREYAQKGMNYDKVKEELERLKAEKQKQLDLQEAEKLIEEKGYVVDDENDKITLLQATKKAEFEKSLKSAKEILFNSYPNLKENDITPEMLDNFNNGIPLITSYERGKNNSELESLKNQVKELQEKLEASETNDDNANTSVGSISDGGATNDNSELYTKEQLAKLSPKEIEKNLDKALKSMAYYSEN